MNRLFATALLLLFSTCIYSQAAPSLFIKKGFHKKRTYTEGDPIILRLKDDAVLAGIITLLRNDTIFLSGRPIPISGVTTVILTTKTKRKFHTSPEEVGLITAGVALTTVGLTLNDNASLSEALTAGLAIGYGPLLIRYIGSKISLKRRKFLIGKKFRLQILDFYLSPRQQRAF